MLLFPSKFAQWVAIIAGFASLVSSTSLSDIPSLVARIPLCAIGPLTMGYAAAGCGVTDYACQCVGFGRKVIAAHSQQEIQKSCGDGQSLFVQDLVDKICAAAEAAPQELLFRRGATMTQTGSTSFVSFMTSRSSTMMVSSFASFPPIPRPTMTSLCPAPVTVTVTVTAVPAGTGGYTASTMAPPQQSQVTTNDGSRPAAGSALVLGAMVAVVAALGM